MKVGENKSDFIQSVGMRQLYASSEDGTAHPCREEVLQVFYTREVIGVAFVITDVLCMSWIRVDSVV